MHAAPRGNFGVIGGTSRRQMVADFAAPAAAAASAAGPDIPERAGSTSPCAAPRGNFGVIGGTSRRQMVADFAAAAAAAAGPDIPERAGSTSPHAAPRGNFGWYWWYQPAAHGGRLCWRRSDWTVQLEGATEDAGRCAGRCCAQLDFNIPGSQAASCIMFRVCVLPCSHVRTTRMHNVSRPCLWRAAEH